MPGRHCNLSPALRTKWGVSVEYEDLSDEQQRFVNYALSGYNIIVDACIGSGKTTAIQVLCSMLPPCKSVVYLTYNKLLKVDAKSKISRSVPCVVTNYHSYAYMLLYRAGLGRGVPVSETFRTVIDRRVRVPRIDVIILDEYQDIDSDIAGFLLYLKSCNPHAQFVVVGDMAQKIYDKTTLAADQFVVELAGGEDFLYRLEFTRCFRLSSEHAALLGEIWGKDIVGMNPDMRVRRSNWKGVARYLMGKDPASILCIGANGEMGDRTKIQNTLEHDRPDKFNKYTVWSKIDDGDAGATQPDDGSAIFTTMDGCKGMERNICVVCDFTESYWNIRAGKNNARYEILRNIFCVAASRGKKEIIFCLDDDEEMLSKETLMLPFSGRDDYDDVDMSTAFGHMCDEHKRAAMERLSIKEISPIGTEIKVRLADGNIDLSPCVGTYVEVNYFDNTSIDTYIETYFEAHPDIGPRTGWKSWSVSQKTLYFTYLWTRQARYYEGVKDVLVQDYEWDAIERRLSSTFTQQEETQAGCMLNLYRTDGERILSMRGFADVVKDGIVYELKFVSEFCIDHYLQCAMYMLGLGLDRGRLYNIKTGQMMEITIPDKAALMDAVVTTVTKGRINACECRRTLYAPPEKGYNRRMFRRNSIKASKVDMDTKPEKVF